MNTKMKLFTVGKFYRCINPGNASLTKGKIYEHLFKETSGRIFLQNDDGYNVRVAAYRFTDKAVRKDDSQMKAIAPVVPTAQTVATAPKAVPVSNSISISTFEVGATYKMDIRGNTAVCTHSDEQTTVLLDCEHKTLEYKDKTDVLHKYWTKILEKTKIRIEGYYNIQPTGTVLGPYLTRKIADSYNLHGRMSCVILEFQEGEFDN